MTQKGFTVFWYIDENSNKPHWLSSVSAEYDRTSNVVNIDQTIQLVRQARRIYVYVSIFYGHVKVTKTEALHQLRDMEGQLAIRIDARKGHLYIDPVEGY